MTSMDRERTFFVEMTPAMRRRIEATVENLRGLLDDLGGDADFEPEEFEDDPAEAGVADYDALTLEFRGEAQND